MATFDPVTAADGLVAGWTAFNGFNLGKSQADVANRFVVWDTSYINWFFTSTIYQTATTRPNHYIKTNGTVGQGNVAVYFNAAVDGSTRHEIVVNGATGAWQYNYELGGMQSGTATLPGSGTYDIEVDAADANAPVVKINGVTITLSAPSNVRTGLYVGVQLAAGNDIGVIQVEPGGGGAGVALALGLESGSLLMLEGGADALATEG